MNGGDEDTNVFYHGSPCKIKDGECIHLRPSAVVDNEQVVFATNTYSFAVVFAAKWTDLDIEFGFDESDDNPYIKEQYPDAFCVFNVPGWIHVVDKAPFKNDARLGLQGYEFISRTEVPIIDTHYIKNVLLEILRRRDIKLKFYKEPLPRTDDGTK